MTDFSAPNYFQKQIDELTDERDNLAAENVRLTQENLNLCERLTHSKLAAQVDELLSRMKHRDVVLANQALELERLQNIEVLAEMAREHAPLDDFLVHWNALCAALVKKGAGHAE